MKEELNRISFCPFCGEDDCVEVHDDMYLCKECECEFDADDLEHELLRQRISSICSAFEATEENPLSCVLDDAMELHIEGIDEEAQGLSESEKPMVTAVYHDYEGIVWAVIDGDDIEIDDILTVSLKQILEWLEKNYSINALGHI